MSLNLLYDESHIIAEVAHGNEKAFRILFDRYWDKIFSVAFLLSKSVVVSEEMVQDVFLKIWMNREKLPEIGNFEGYLFITCRNHIINELRNKVKIQEFTNSLHQHFQEANQLPEEQFIFKESEQLVMAAVEQLPPQQRKIFLLSRKEGFSHDEIARLLGLSRLTVKTHVHAALKRIRSIIEKQGGPG